MITKEEAAELFAYNPFKLEIINTKIPDGAATTIYRNGPFIDLCMGPHIPNTGMIKTMKVRAVARDRCTSSREQRTLADLNYALFPSDLQSLRSLLDG